MNGFALIGIAVTLWSFGSGVVAKTFTVPALMWYPVAAGIATIVCAIILAWRGSLKQLWPENKTARWLLLGTGITVLFNNGLFFTALQITSVPIAQLTHYLTPLFLAVIFAPWLLKEPASRREAALTVVGLIGLAIVLWPDLSSAHLDMGAVLGAASALFFSVGTVCARKLSAYNVSGLSPAVWQNAVPAVGMLPFMLYFMSHGAHFVTSDWLGISYMGVVSIGIGFSLYLLGLMKVKKASHAGIMTYGEPIGAIILAAIFLGEPMTVYVIIGGILIIGSGMALVLGKND